MNSFQSYCLSCEKTTWFKMNSLDRFFNSKHPKYTCQNCQHFSKTLLELRFIQLGLENQMKYFFQPKQFQDHKCGFGKYSALTYYEVVTNHPSYIFDFVFHQNPRTSSLGLKKLLMYSLGTLNDKSESYLSLIEQRY